MLNYSPKAIEELRRAAGIVGSLMPASGRICRWAADSLERSQKFLVPENGLVFGAAVPLKLDDMLDDDAVRLPYPLTAVEFRVEKGFYPTYASAPHFSARRLALAVDLLDPMARADAIAAFGPLLGLMVDRTGAAACLVLSIDEVGPGHGDWPGVPPFGWMIGWCAMYVPYNQARAKVGTTPIEFGAPILEEGRAAQPLSIYFDVLPVGEAGVQMVQRYSAKADLTRAAAEFSLEAGAVMGLLAALRCRNIGTRVEAPPEKLQAARRKRGQTPLPSYHVLDLHLGDTPQDNAGSASGRQVRTHWRRGHVRRLADGGRIWINHTIVKPGGEMAAKDYRLRG